MVRQRGMLGAGMCLALGIGGSFAAGAAQGVTACYSAMAPASSVVVLQRHVA